MDQPANGAAPAIAQATGQADPAQTAPEFKVPDGKRLVDSAEYDRLSNDSQRGRWLQPYYDRVTKLGVKKPEDLDRWLKFNDTVSKQGFDLDTLAQAFSPQQTQEQPQGSGISQAELDKYMESKGIITKDQFESEFSIRSALMEHQQAMKGEEDLFKSIYPDVLGEKFDPAEQEWLELQAKIHRLDLSNRGMYPPGHPLHPEKAKDKAELAPFNKDSISKFRDEMKQQMAKRRGAALASAGDAVNKGARASSVAGATGSKSPSTPPKKDEKDPQIGSPEHNRLVEAAYAARQARRNGGTTSSLGG